MTELVPLLGAGGDVSMILLLILHWRNDRRLIVLEQGIKYLMHRISNVEDKGFKVSRKPGGNDREFTLEP